MKKVLLIFVLLLILGGCRSSHSEVDFHTHYSLNPLVPQVIFDGQRIEGSIPFIEFLHDDNALEVPHVYLNADFLRRQIDPFVFWDEGARVLFVSTLYEMLEFSPGNEFFLVNGSPRPLDDVIIERDGAIFVPASLVHQLYPVEIEYKPLYNLVVITSLTEAQTTASVSVNKANVRFWPSDRATIATQLSRGDELVIFLGAVNEHTDETSENYVRVQTADGLPGFVLISDIENLNTSMPFDFANRETILDDFIDNTTHQPQTYSGGLVNLVWEQASNPDANRINMQTPFHPSVTVVSPTWFEINRDEAFLDSVASMEYVEWAHQQGVQVWPNVFDVWNDRSRRILMDRNARTHVIKQIIQFVELYNLDGINIDFEHLMSPEEGPYKIQFLRELAIPLRQRGVVLSAAVKVPIPTNMFYRRDLIGLTVDFVMVMAYDEYWSTSPEAGPNASLSFVRDAVENTLLQVPRERLILGVPFYNRVWREVVSTSTVTHHAAMGTNSTRAFFEERGVKWEWDFTTGSYYGDVADFEDEGTVIYRVWLEDARSMQEKMHVFDDNNLAGVAIWSRLFSIDEFWEVIGQYF